VKTRNFVGTVVTGLWLAGAAILAVTKHATWPSMSLNQWGDFFAGVVAPLAFLWLILGYVQQGEEVRENTETLRQQQQALQRQVEETAALASHSAEQVKFASERLDLERQRFEHQRKMEKARVQPVFTYVSGRGGSSAANYEVKYKNNGGIAKSIVVKVVYPPCRVVFNPSDVEAGDSGLIGLDGITSYPTKVSIGYLDKDNDVQGMMLDFYEPGKFRSSPMPEG